MGVENAAGLHSPDLVTLSGILKICELELVLLGKQSPKAFADSLAVEDAVLFSGEVDFAFRGRFAVPPQWCMFGYIHHTSSESWCHGTPLGSDMAFTVVPEGISEIMLSAGTRITAVMVPLLRLHTRFADLKPFQMELPSRALSLFQLAEDGRGALLRSLMEDLRDRVLGDETAMSTLQDYNVNDLLEVHLLAGLAARGEDRPVCSRGRHAHYQVVQRAEDFMRQNLRRDIYLNELCSAAGVSERALRYAFDDLLGVSPNRYLSMLRLCMACKNLTLSDASRRSVKSVALSCGLWDLSRFADHYRRVFGELPRDTLMRSPPLELA
ncbi:AraC family transcriptional regulator [Dyella sp. ASV21]|uniref:AraC family transcriptional regulator n=1 Tax=Dyella sp. ASV21 TaxID=2795114 RepID=UPI0018EDE79A|nr:AraC family transcriptional regulator [Dyella sp. ASV21]